MAAPKHVTDKTGSGSGNGHDHNEPISLGDAVRHAVGLHQSGQLAEAERLYRLILNAIPGQVDALHFLGVVRHQTGHSEEAVELIRQSIAADPSLADRHNNLGNVLKDLGRLEEAEAAYRRALRIDPSHAFAHGNLGVVLRALGRFEAAEESYLRAIALQPNNPDFHSNLGVLLLKSGREAEAIDAYCHALTLRPKHAESLRMLGFAYHRLGQIDQAVAHFRAWVETDPDNPIARHLYAAYTGENVPARATDDFIVQTFDQFAKSFDAKLERLQYRAPQLIVEALQRAAGHPRGRLDGLDAGCGTGLCGALVKPFMRSLVGVDLSGAMLAEARRRRVYDAVRQDELVTFMNRHVAKFDVVVSADTLCYFGALEPPARAAARALRAKGLLVFTLEHAATDAPAGGYRLNPHGRYSHSKDYVERTLVNEGLVVLAIEEAVLRMETAQPVAGLVVTARLG